MKSVLLHANQDAGLESRLQAALDLVRLFDGHLTCLHTTPYEAFITGDPFGGVYALPVVVRSEEHTSELQSQSNLVCRLLLEKKKSPS